MTTDLAERESALVTVNPEQRIDEMIAEQHLLDTVISKLMKSGEHFGVIPGTQKPTLYKPGADLLSRAFALAPKFEIERREMPGGHVEYTVTCDLYANGNLVGSGVGSCSTAESKYRWRNAARKCPICGKEAIIKGKAEYGGGWICFAKKDGCGAKFEADDPSIIDQPVGKVENPDIADQYNTVLKMAKKRAYVDAVITRTAASNVFTQDMEDFAEPEQAKPNQKPPQAGNDFLIKKAESYLSEFAGKPDQLMEKRAGWHKAEIMDRLDEGSWTQIDDKFVQAIRACGIDPDTGELLEMQTAQKGEQLGLMNQNGGKKK